MTPGKPQETKNTHTHEFVKFSLGAPLEIRDEKIRTPDVFSGCPLRRLQENHKNSQGFRCVLPGETVRKPQEILNVSFRFLGSQNTNQIFNMNTKTPGAAPTARRGRNAAPHRVRGKMPRRAAYAATCRVAAAPTCALARHYLEAGKGRWQTEN